MPVAIITALRFLVVAIMQTTAWVAVSSALEGLVDYLRQTFKTKGGMTETEVDDTIANEIIDALALIGVTVVSLKTKIPIRLADKLGLKATSVSKRALSQSTKAKVAKTTASGALATTNMQKILLAFGMSFAGSLPWLPTLVQGVGDQATFNARNANNFYENILGFRPFSEADASESAGPFTRSEFESFAYALEATGIKFLLQTTGAMPLPYTRDNLARLVEEVYGTSLLAGKALTKTTIVSVLAKYFPAGTKLPTISGATSGVSTVGSVKTISLPQVYTGYVSSGQLGATVAFNERRDDLIEDDTELRSAAQTNIAAFAGALPGKISYEISIVSSVKTPGGNSLSAGVQKIQIGTYKNGTPKYKTVYNKWAVADIFIDTDTKKNVKVSRIVLGPTNGASYQPTTGGLSGISADIKSNLVAPAGSLPVATAQPLASTQVGADALADAPTASQSVPQAVQIEPRDYYVEREGFYDAVYYREGDLIYKAHFVDEMFSNDEKVAIGNYGAQIEKAKARLLEYGVNVNTFRQDPFPFEINGERPRNMIQITPWQDFFKPRTGTPMSPAPSATAPGAGATTLSAWFSAQGRTLPALSERAKLYEARGLGPAVYYAGTAEQNTRLLESLKTSGL